MLAPGRIVPTVSPPMSDTAAVVDVPPRCRGVPEGLEAPLDLADLDVLQLGPLEQLGHLAERVDPLAHGPLAYLLERDWRLQFDNALFSQVDLHGRLLRIC